MHPNAALLQRFYTAFAARDADIMAACYAPDATFRDAAFDLRGAEIGSMWKMLCLRGKDLTLEFRDVTADDTRGSAHWEPRYTFSATKRPVHNVIDSAFEFRDGLIVKQVDTFDFWRWSRQALGPVGLLFGWLPALQTKVRAQAMASLRQFEKAKS